MNKLDFTEHNRYTVTLRDSDGRLRPANLYVYRLYDQFMVARMTDHAGLLCRVDYADIVKIVRQAPVAKEDQYLIPDAVLKESTWLERKFMDRYSTSPHIGK